MSFAVIQAGTALQMMDSDGTLVTLTLPTGVTLDSALKPRFAVFGRQVIVVNTPTQPLTVDSTGIVRLLSPKPPRVATSLSGVAGGALSGTYKVEYTFVTVDADGRLISESDFSPVSPAVTITNQFLKASGLDISPDQVTGRRLYRTTTNGAVFFQWIDLDGNILTEVQDDLSDAGLSIIAAPILGTPPDLTLISEFRDRLFGVGRVDIDDVVYTEPGLAYAWPADNVFPIPKVGSDIIGITGLASRREALAVGRRNQLSMLTGTGDEDFRIVKLSENCGFMSQESVNIFRDVATFLWEDGVYQWSDEGISCISDGKVRSWFATDSYFNRSRFPHAFGIIDPIRYKYRLYLAAAGSVVENRWVEYDLKEKTWWGPHLTSRYTPTSTFIVTNSELVQIPVTGSQAADVWREQDTRTDGAATPIDFDVVTKRHDADNPEYEKFWGQLSVIGKAQSFGTTDISMSVGELNAEETQTDSWDMTKSRQRLSRPGLGKHVQLEFTNNEIATDVELYEYIMNPVSIVGRR